MRIEGKPSPVIADPPSSDRAKTVSNRPDSGEPRGAVVLSIGDAAAKLAASSARLSESVSARLQEVRRMIADNSYPIDFDRLAERILDDESARAGVD
jgi:anti-sigma28 factor (negative regulator of flagellin synthesis)